MAKTGTTGASVTIDIPMNQYYSPTSKATGGVAFDPLTGGTTTVAVAAPGFNSAWSGSSQAVTVNQPAMTIPDSAGTGNRIGASLQVQFYVDLGASATNHGGVTVHVESSDNTKVRLSISATTAGTASLDIPVANGQRYAYFYVQGVRSATGTATLTATQALFATTTATITVVQPVFYNIVNLTTPTTTLSADNDFYVYTGVLNAAGTSFQQYQVVSGEGTLPVTFTSSNPAVGQMAKTGTTGASVTIDIPVNQYYSPTNKATGGIAFDPLTGGTTTVAVTAPGFNSAWSGSSQAVTVSQPAMTITDIGGGGNRVGGGLQNRYRITLGGSAHGGVTVRVASSDTTRLLLAADAITPGIPFIDLFIADGQTTKDFYVQGINGVTGTVTLTTTNALFTTGTTSVEVVQSVIGQFGGLSASKTVGSANDAFYVVLGILNAAGTSVQANQNVSPAGPIQVLLTSSNVAVAQLVTNVASGAQVTVGVPINIYYSPTTKAAGGVEIDWLTTGSTTVAATVNGFNNGYAGAALTVTVTP
jgi:hypothetical protein